MILPDKGADFLLECLARMTVPYQADFVGHGPHFDEIKALCTKLGLDDKVTLHGWVEADEKDHLYRNANVFAFPATWKEPVGFVGFEAMVYGLPVVAQDVGGELRRDLERHVLEIDRIRILGEADPGAGEPAF